ncbi:uncharacterized protein N7482_010469 [Penicillium canariense]|uniref:Protein kinase domain-containing protein n=1 Tax=Penicillium canariense TaxID=189055 RepID=A0A9W9HKT2_9EURO|nr:uncharacterized protein N7482_010469 [Penicillium canariense]KAJ5151217.1 hypothetical protein N7482_010469 [Penicillium canariense]
MSLPSLSESNFRNYRSAYLFDLLPTSGQAARGRDDVSASKVRVDPFQKISHKNVVNLREVFLAEDAAFFVYDEWDVPLEDIWRRSVTFRLGEVGIACICKGILEGLKYVHDVLDLYHGALNLDNIFITDNGDVKLAHIGDSMTLEPNPQGKTEDIQALGHIVHILLGPEHEGGMRGVLGYLAYDFTKIPPNTTAEDLLQV